MDRRKMSDNDHLLYIPIAHSALLEQVYTHFIPVPLW